MDWLKNARKSAGLTQATVADALNIDRTSYLRIESGERGLSASELSIVVELLSLDPAEALQCARRSGEAA